MNARQSWLDEKTESPIIDEHVQRLASFVDAIADGRIDDSELAAQESRLVDLMKQVEPQLDDALHGQVTQLLCELSAFNMMQMMHTMQAARPASQFRG